MSACDILTDIINNKPRKDWYESLKPYIIEESDRSMIVKDPNETGYFATDEFMITKKELSEDYRSPFTRGDIVKYDNSLWVVFSIPMLDSRHDLDFMKSKDWNLFYEGAYLEIIKADEFGNPNPERVVLGRYNGMISIDYFGYKKYIRDSDLVFAEPSEIDKGTLILSERVKKGPVTVELD